MHTAFIQRLNRISFEYIIFDFDKCNDVDFLLRGKLVEALVSRDILGGGELKQQREIKSLSTSWSFSTSKMTHLSSYLGHESSVWFHKPIVSERIYASNLMVTYSET